MIGYTRFNVPVKRDEFGSVHTQPVLVEDELLPVMAAIVAAASKPVRLTQEHVIDRLSRQLSEAELGMIVRRTRQVLEDDLRAAALRDGLAVITEIRIEEPSPGCFLASAVGMPLIEVRL